MSLTLSLAKSFRRCATALNNQISNRLFLGLLAISLCSQSLIAAEVELFYETPKWGALPVSDYRTLVRNLSYGDVIRFSDDKAFTFSRYLGHGNTSFILEIKESTDSVLRVPLSSGKMIPFSNFQLPQKAIYYIDDIFKGSEILEHLGIEHANIDRRSYRQSERVLMKRVHNPVTLKQLWISQKNGFTEEQIRSLVLWAEQTSALKNIGDFNADQLAYEAKTKKWVLLDWSYGAELYVPWVDGVGAAKFTTVLDVLFEERPGLGVEIPGLKFNGKRWEFTEEYLQRFSYTAKAFGDDKAFWKIGNFETDEMDFVTHAQMLSLKRVMNLVTKRLLQKRKHLRYTEQEFRITAKKAGKDEEWVEQTLKKTKPRVVERLTFACKQLFSKFVVWTSI